MPFQDMMLHIDTYPDPTPDRAVEQAIGFAKLVGVAVEVDIPLASNRLADYLVGLSGLVHTEEAKSRGAARAAPGAFRRSLTDLVAISHGRRSPFRAV